VSRPRAVVARPGSPAPSSTSIASPARSGPGDGDEPLDSECSDDAPIRRRGAVVAGSPWVSAVALAGLAIAVATALRHVALHPPHIADAAACEGVTLTSFLRGAGPAALGGTGDVLGTAKTTWACAEAYRSQSPGYVLALFAGVYVALQAFAIPGPLILSIIAGALYGTLRGQLLIAACATTGASICYWLSWLLARPLLTACARHRLADFQRRVRGVGWWWW
jgi:hypothetical protein